VGDSDNDIIPANNLGVYSVYVNYGYGKLNEKIVPKLTLSKMSDFKKLF
jgi:phosphoglycolate phosphatase-like HAD superfamily hydrolase